jgi:hypothetical protein
VQQVVIFVAYTSVSVGVDANDLPQQIADKRASSPVLDNDPSVASPIGQQEDPLRNSRHTYRQDDGDRRE